ncbi:MAG: triose-phosphate isomerase [Deltaproteobacteria bacterium]|jgi:triosephosphate isomerase|nr:triose-phosphate isomerase [Deltaproteobacteria bacterium]
MSNPRIPRPFFCGNWKLWGTLSDSVALATGVRDAVASVTTADVAVAPGFVALDAVAGKLKGSAVAVASQDGYWEEKGAFTGEVAMVQIADCGASYAIVGHSERRQYFGETDETVARKAKAALAAGLVPILCIGETLPERDAGQALTVVGKQLDGTTANLRDDELAKSVIAYEPVWAIGTGRVATPAQAQEVHALIRSKLVHKLQARAQQVRILYGGSVKPNNVAELMKEKDIDGALVGGASLTVDSFASIVQKGVAACTRS